MEGTEALLASTPNFPPSKVVAQYPELPPEILSAIFLRAIAPDFLLDSSLTAGPASPWWKAVETTLSISAVCISWHFAGIRFLYENVVFRNLRQLPTFLRTIKTNPLKYQNLIKQITIYAFVYPRYGASFSTYLQNIIDSCPSLKRFSFPSPTELPCTAVIPTLNPEITHLCLRTATPIILSLLDCVRDSLISLTIIIHNPSLEIINVDKTFPLPNLRDLSIYAEDKEPLDRMLDLLLVPRLRRFFFMFCHPDDLRGPLASFLKTYGYQVTVLHLEFVFAAYHLLRTSSETEYLQKLLDACPMLEHFGLYPGFFSPLTHSNVKWLDIGQEPPPRGHKKMMWTLSKAKAAFPKLKGLREVHSPEHIVQPMSVALPPNLVMSDDEAFDLTFPGIELQYRPGIIRIARFIDDPTGYSGFEYPNRDSDSDSITDSDSDVSDCSSEDLEATESESVGSLGDLLELVSEDDE